MKRLEKIEETYKEMMKYKDEQGNVSCFPSYDDAALKFADDGHVEWMIRKIKAQESVLSQVEAILQEAIVSIDEGEEVQGLEYGTEINGKLMGWE